MRLLAILLLAATLAAPTTPLAGPAITLNGVGIAGVTNQKFENVTVIIDAQGNLEIQAKGYAARLATPVPPQVPPASDPSPAAPGLVTLPPAVAGASATSPSAPPARLGRRYFLATEQSQPDATLYDVEVFINASWIRVVKSAEPQVVTEVTRYLRPGTNKVTFSCTKKPASGERRGGSAEATLKVVVGAGNVGGDHVMIDEPLAVMIRTGAEVDDKVEEFVFEAR
jgi:hypothetical protein